jgi:hypothetical protein
MMFVGISFCALWFILTYIGFLHFRCCGCLAPASTASRDVVFKSLAVQTPYPLTQTVQIRSSSMMMRMSTIPGSWDLLAFEFCVQQII